MKTVIVMVAVLSTSCVSNTVLMSCSVEDKCTVFLKKLEQTIGSCRETRDVLNSKDHSNNWVCQNI